MCLAFMNTLLWTDLSVCVCVCCACRKSDYHLASYEMGKLSFHRVLVATECYAFRGVHWPCAESPSCRVCCLLFMLRTSLSMALGPATDGNASLLLHHSIYIFMSHFYFVRSHSQPRPPTHSMPSKQNVLLILSTCECLPVGSVVCSQYEEVIRCLPFSCIRFFVRLLLTFSRVMLPDVFSHTDDDIAQIYLLRHSVYVV